MSTAGQLAVADVRGEPLPLAELMARWNLGAWTSAERLPGGKNEHVRVVTDRGAFFLRRSYRSKAAAALERQLALLSWLRGQGLPVPEPIPTADGSPVATVAGRLYVVTRALPGSPYDPARPAHLQAAGRVLARYHQLVAELPPAEPQTDRPELLTALHDRLARVDEAAAPDLVRGARAVLIELADRWPELPRCLIHGGSRRGSVLFDGDRLSGLLDFDSARHDVRVLDLATAVHDFGKVYSTLGAADHKVPLDLERIAGFLSAYAEVRPVPDVEAEALPALLAAKRLQRALGRAARHAAGLPLSANDLAKIELERARLHWLARHRDALAAAVVRAVG